MQLLDAPSETCLSDAVAFEMCGVANILAKDLTRMVATGRLQYKRIADRDFEHYAIWYHQGDDNMLHINAAIALSRHANPILLFEGCYELARILKTNGIRYVTNIPALIKFGYDNGYRVTSHILERKF